MGPCPSYSWRSILSSRSMLEMGVRWKVCNGNSIKMWKDAWLRVNGIGKLITPIRVLNREATVVSLLDNERHLWRRDIISEVLFPIDKDRILNVPICTTGEDDVRVWVASKDGSFRVRDMYALALSNSSSGECSTGSDPIWKKFWSLRIHPKAKVFLWRALWDILPHGSNLRKKGIANVGYCGRCGFKETNSHVLRDCAWARKVWLNFSNQQEFLQPYITIREWLGIIIQHRKQEEVELFAVTLWQIWCARNLSLIHI